MVSFLPKIYEDTVASIYCAFINILPSCSLNYSHYNNFLDLDWRSENPSPVNALNSSAGSLFWKEERKKF
jgi:hypothetical protein